MYVVIERKTGYPSEEDCIYGPFPAKVVANLWLMLRKNELEKEAQGSNRAIYLRYHPYVFKVVPLFSPHWPEVVDPPKTEEMTQDPYGNAT